MLIGFPTVIIASVWLVFFLINEGQWDGYVQEKFLVSLPFIIGAVGLWFLIAYTFHSKMIQFAVHSRPLERKENMRVYNLVENLCMSQGMSMPKVFIIESDALNAFASGLNEKTYSVTLTRGIINKLNDAELEGVIAHELAHIKNKDVKLLVISVIFVGILAFVVQVAFRSVLYGGHRRSNNNKQDGRLVLIILLVSAIAYFLTILFRFGLSRKREYMADAAAAEMTRRPDALASALRKISGHSTVDDVRSDDVKGMFIENNPKEQGAALSGFTGLFATHPPIEKRIAFLEQV
ncbi:M48 family metallopeptidase [Paracrocinitomix mangrovi]|uniref:M48 family metallopeptidase n=1 Tax=Paracrocinitomix mangrovi TaxID=2862509 RepID=UPI001C8F1D5D|nr:M48 family metallopeptidase [Paracrocinitomix mangrovi]UKN03867.1 M48 family metallopeptidase [Paracrocinitomix mangrovi]